jgi:hypothetical protein
MAVGSDGATLFVVDTGATPKRVVPVDLTTWTPGASWALPASADATTRLAYARTNGVPVLLASSGSVHAPATGATYATFAAPYAGPTVGVSRNGARFCAADTGSGPYQLRCFALDSTTSAGLASPVIVGAARSPSASAGGFGQDLALSPDGTRAYFGGGSSAALWVYDTSALSGAMPVAAQLATTQFVDAVDVAPDGRVFAGRYGFSSGVLGWDGSGNSNGTWDVGEVTANGLAISGDGRRLAVLIGYSTSTALKLVTVPAP